MATFTIISTFCLFTTRNFYFSPVGNATLRRPLARHVTNSKGGGQDTTLPICLKAASKSEHMPAAPGVHKWPVSHPGTVLAKWCLTSVFKWELIWPNHSLLLRCSKRKEPPCGRTIWDIHQPQPSIPDIRQNEASDPFRVPEVDDRQVGDGRSDVGQQHDGEPGYNRESAVGSNLHLESGATIKVQLRKSLLRKVLNLTIWFRVILSACHRHWA